MLARDQPQIGSVLIRFFEPPEIAGFGDERHRRNGLDTEKADQFSDIFPVFRLLGQLRDPLIITGDFRRQFSVRNQIFAQRFPKTFRQLRLMQPADVGFGPVGGAGAVQIMTQAERLDLLLDSFQHFLMIIPHADIFFDGVIRFGWDIYSAVSSA